MIEFAFNSIEEAIYMNGHGIYVWIVVIIVFFSLTYAFIYYENKISKIRNKK
tara:strand:+ start:1206 stop:1361 length:156 start_codon:yes stop_codon:yes gene_type:complete